MKKILLSAFLIFMLAGIFATPSSGEAVAGVSESSGLSVTLDLSSSGTAFEQFEIGFSSNKVDSFASPVSAVNTASLIGSSGNTGRLAEDRYVYWKIASADPVRVWLDVSESMAGSKGNTLAWTVSTNPAGGVGGIGISSRNQAEADGFLLLDRSEGFKYGTAGSQRLSVSTGSYLNTIIDTYTGILTLRIKSL